MNPEEKITALRELVREARLERRYAGGVAPTEDWARWRVFDDIAAVIADE
jgi:hypothetical protein